MPDARTVEVVVDVPANVRVDLAGERDPSSGGKIRVTSIASSTEDARSRCWSLPRGERRRQALTGAYAPGATRRPGRTGRRVDHGAEAVDVANLRDDLALQPLDLELGER